MNDSRTLDTADSRQVIATMKQKRVHQRSPGRSRSRMNRHAGRLVDHNQIPVFIRHVKRNILRLRIGFFRRRHFQLINVAAANPEGIIHNQAVVGRKVATGNQALYLRTGHFPKTCRQKTIQTLSLLLRRHRRTEKYLVLVHIHI